jgi:hypothetical protein
LLPVWWPLSVRCVMGRLDRLVLWYLQGGL